MPVQVCWVWVCGGRGRVGVGWEGQSGCEVGGAEWVWSEKGSVSVCLSVTVPTLGRTWCSRSEGSSLRGDYWGDRPQRTSRGTGGGQRSWAPGRPRRRRRRERGRASLERTWCCRAGGGAASPPSRSCRASGSQALPWGTQGLGGEWQWEDGCSHGNCCQVERSPIHH